MHFKITSETPKGGIGQWLILLLLSVYIAGTSQLELLHLFVHSNDFVVAHSDEQEKDPCHRLLYHNDIEQGCDNHAHLTVSDKCQMCDLVNHGDQNLLSVITFPDADFPQDHFVFHKSDLDCYWAVISSSRAPPALV